MPTTLYYIDTLSSLAISGVVVRSLSTARGSGVITKTVASHAAPPVKVVDTGSTPLCFAYRVNGFTSTAGTYTHNHWGHESNAMANYGAGTSTTNSQQAGVQVYTNAGVHVGSLQSAAFPASEYGTSSAAWSITGTGSVRTVTAGDWIVVFPSHDQAGGTAASGYTLSFAYNGTSAAANGDTFVTLPDTITEFVAAADKYAGLMAPLNVNQAVHRASRW